MKTIYSVLFVLTISLSTIYGQSLTSTLQGRGRSLNIESNNPYPKITDYANGLNFIGNEEFQSNTDNQLLSAMYTQNKAQDQSNSTIYLLDSLVNKDNKGIYQSKVEYIYNSKGLQISYKTYNSWDTTNKIWKAGTKTESTYDSVGHQILYIYSTWDATNKIWKIYSKYEFTFDGNGYLTNNSSFKWDATNSKWINWNKAETTNDNNGNKTLFISYLWDAVNNVWNMTNKTEYTYDGTGLQTLAVSYSYSANTWKESSKSEYSYDSNGHRILSISYNWDATTIAWKGNSKTEYSYNSDGLQISYTSYTWDATNTIWKVSTKTENIYDGFGHKTLSISYKWDATNIWKENSKTEYTNDSNGNVIQTNYWLYAANVWVRNQIGTYYYSIFINTSAVVIPVNTKISIYPNPAKCEIRINGINDPSKFTLTDMNGKLVMSRNIRNNEAISISSLSKGIYVVKLITHEGSIVSKLIKE